MKTENGVIVGVNCQRNFTRSRSVFNAKETQYSKKNENRVRQAIILNIFAYISTKWLREFQQLKQNNKNNPKSRRLTAVIATSALPSPPLSGEENARRLWAQIAIAGNNGITIPLTEEIHQHCRLIKGYQKVFDRFQT